MRRFSHMGNIRLTLLRRTRYAASDSLDLGKRVCRISSRRPTLAARHGAHKHHKGTRNKQWAMGMQDRVAPTQAAARNQFPADRETSQTRKPCYSTWLEKNVCIIQRGLIFLLGRRSPVSSVHQLLPGFFPHSQNLLLGPLPRTGTQCSGWGDKVWRKHPGGRRDWKTINRPWSVLVLVSSQRGQECLGGVESQEGCMACLWGPSIPCAGSVCKKQKGAGKGGREVP